MTSQGDRSGVDGVPESAIRAMTRLARAHDAVNLAQGFPDSALTPDAVVEAAADALREDNQYSVTWGRSDLREAIASDCRARYGVAVDSQREVTVTCGTSEAVFAAVIARAGPGDAVACLEPYSENSVPATRIAGAAPRTVPLARDGAVDRDALADALRDSAVFVLNNPHNPLGVVLDRDLLGFVADLAVDHDVTVVADEVYERMVYGDADGEGDDDGGDGSSFTSCLEIDGLRERTVRCTGISKTYSLTGWRVGFAVAPPHLTDALRSVHDYATICAPQPLQRAAVTALELDEGHAEEMRAMYRRRRDLLRDGLAALGFDANDPDAAYYLAAGLPDGAVDAVTREAADGDASTEDGTVTDDRAFAERLARDAGVAVVPGSSFVEAEADWVRFTFSRSDATLEEALERMRDARWW